MKTDEYDNIREHHVHSFGINMAFFIIRPIWIGLSFVNVMDFKWLLKMALESSDIIR